MSGKLLPVTSKMKNPEEIVESDFFVLLNKKLPIFEIHTRDKICKKFALSQDGWRLSKLPCIMEHLTSLKPKIPVRINWKNLFRKSLN